MFRNYLTSALRHLARNGLYAGISVFCLSIGLSVALVVGLMVRQELSFERFLPGYERTYVAASVIAPADRSPMYFLESPGFVAASMTHMFPEIEEITRMVDATVRLRHGEFEAKERIYWADPNVFSVLQLRAVAGDLPSALKQPDGIVLTNSIAKKYFGDQSAMGQTMTLNGQHPQKVTAVVRDLPYSTNLVSGIFVSGLAPYSGVSKCDRNDVENAKNGGVSLCGLTFFRLRDRARVDRISAEEAALVASWHLPQNFPMAPHTAPFIRIDKIHLFDGLHPGAQLRVAETAAIGLLILFAACVVYVNLTTARSSRRALEVGVRKVCGADRHALALQFLGESVLYVLLASVVAVSLTELALPSLNSFLDLHVEFAYWRDPILLVEIAFCVSVVGILSGAYPALVLSAFKPVDVLQGPIGLPGGTLARQVMVVIQLAILIVLLSAGAIIYLQQQFATHDAVRLNVDHAFVLAGPCVPPLIEGIRRRPDVDAVVCSDNGLLNSESFSFMKLKSGMPITVNEIALDFEAFRFYGIPMSGRAITPPDLDAAGGSNQDRVVINESLANALGFRSPADALAQPLELRSADSTKDNASNNQEPSAQPVIIGVVPDFALSAAKEPIRPTVYRSLKHPAAAEPRSVDDSGNHLYTWGSLIHVRLNKRSTPETLKAIDNLWVAAIHSDTQLGPRDIWRRSLRDYLEGLYKDVLKQAQTFVVFSIVAVFLSSLGLLGLAAAAAERRTREIGIRKAMGAGRSDVLLMLLKQFTLPVLWASLFAWPVSAILMNRWLLTFPQHIRLPPIVFLAASGLTLLICLLTVSIYAWRVANAAPVIALKYE
jgi:putative ABC transport system permease protein